MAGLVLGAIFLSTALAGCGPSQTAESSTHGHDDDGHAASPHSEPGVFASHLHGVGFSENGQMILVATHQGIAVFENGHWSGPNPPSHDYMGFAPTDAGFYASGHPDHATDLPDPLGLVKVTDGGSKVALLGFGGEVDFHILAAGFFSGTIYLMNKEPTAELPVGLHHSEDGGKSWRRSVGLDGTAVVHRLAAHPTAEGRLAVLTEDGVYLSDDYGDHFRRVPTGFVPTAVAFMPDRDAIVYARQALAFQELTSESRPISYPSPIPPDDTATFLAVNPLAADEIVLITTENDIHRSTDGGVRWDQIATHAPKTSDGAETTTAGGGNDCDCGS